MQKLPKEDERNAIATSLAAWQLGETSDGLHLLAAGKNTYFLQRILFYIPVILVWIGHFRALKAGGYNFKSYWRDAWVKMNFAWERMKPERYQW